MEQKIRVFIADSSLDFSSLLTSALEEQQDLIVVGTAADGDEAYAGLAECRPDVLVTDLLLTGLDGHSLLRKLKSEGNMARTVVVSGFVNDRIALALSRLGVEDYLPKPCNLHELIRRIREVASPEERQGVRDPEPVIREALTSFGIMPHLSGYAYLQESVRMAMKDRTVLRGITKILYPDVAKRFDTTPQCVERAIRSAIEKAWRSGSAERRRHYFGRAFDSFEQTPTNIRFLTAVVEYIEGGCDMQEFTE